MLGVTDWFRSIVQPEISGNPWAWRIGGINFRPVVGKSTRLIEFVHADFQVCD
jgi:hypothetical protein